MPAFVEKSLRNMCRHYSRKEARLLEAAITMAYEGHEGQVRKSSQKPYVIHPFEVAVELQQRFDHAPLTIAGLLHDVAEDSDDFGISDIYDNFGDDIGFLVDAVTKTHLHLHNSHHCFDSYLDKLLFGGLRDVRVFLLKIADRDNNLLTLSSLKSHKQIRISFETQAIFSPLRTILGFDREKMDVDEVMNSFVVFVEKHQLVTPHLLQQHLFHYSFEDITRETFAAVYSRPENVIWEIHDMERYKQLCQDSDFDKATQVLALTTDGTNFKATFRFRTAHLLEQGSLAKFTLSPKSRT